jgi:hypothetical protein
MAVAADRQEFGDSLHDGHDDDGEERHREGTG